MMLPGPHMQPVILDRRGWGHRVAPRGTEPLDGLAGLSVVGEVAERVEHLARIWLPSVSMGCCSRRGECAPVLAVVKPSAFDRGCGPALAGGGGIGGENGSPGLLARA